ncbi:hypothetical protein ACOTDZ_17760 [Achromobacter dolens]|uniref:hypothetical protein n=1 Tax=Achromobacter dolens TaxID=1287738 RepID=UPI003B9F256B
MCPPPSKGGKRALARAVTAYIRAQKRAGKLIARRVFRDPAKGGQKVTVYQFIATNIQLDLEPKP